MRESNGQGKGTGASQRIDSQRVNSEYYPTSGSWMAEAEARMMAKLKNDLKKQREYNDAAYLEFISQVLRGSAQQPIPHPLASCLQLECQQHSARRQPRCGQ